MGWSYDTRRLLVSLPDHKHKAWRKTITDSISSKLILLRELDKLINRLNHMGAIMKMSRHFLSRLRHWFDKSQELKKQTRKTELEPHSNKGP